MTTSALAVSWSELRRSLKGSLYIPGDDGWDGARQPWNIVVNQTPAAVLYPETAEDVQKAVAFAKRNDLRVAPQGTGHASGSLPGLDGTILVRTDRMRKITIDPERRIARAEAGSWWEHVTLAAAEHGLAALAGSSPNVGITGYLLHGGLSWLARKYGLGINTVRAVELVTADGVWRRIDHSNQPELFWAVRGAAGSFGVVTAIEMDLFPLTEVYAGTLVWPADNAPDLLAAYESWSRTAPDEVTGIMSYLNLPPEDGLPEPIRGKRVVTLGAAYIGTEGDGAGVIEPMRRIATPTMDSFTTIPAAELRFLNMDPLDPLPAVVNHLLLTDLDQKAVETLHSLVGPESGSRLMGIEIRQIGASVESRPLGAGATGHFPGRFALIVIGVPYDTYRVDEAQADVDRVIEAMKPWAADRQYLNFVEHVSDGRTGFSPETYKRLQELRAWWDPTELFLPAHAVRVAG